LNLSRPRAVPTPRMRSSNWRRSRPCPGRSGAVAEPAQEREVLSKPVLSLVDREDLKEVLQSRLLRTSLRVDTESRTVAVGRPGRDRVASRVCVFALGLTRSRPTRIRRPGEIVHWRWIPRGETVRPHRVGSPPTGIGEDRARRGRLESPTGSRSSQGTEGTLGQSAQGRSDLHPGGAYLLDRALLEDRPRAHVHDSRAAETQSPREPGPSPSTSGRTPTREDGRSRSSESSASGRSRRVCDPGRGETAKAESEDHDSRRYAVTAARPTPSVRALRVHPQRGSARRRTEGPPSDLHGQPG